MKYIINLRFGKQNYLSWLLIVCYFLAILSMDVLSTRFTFEGTVLTLPLILLILLLIQKNNYLINLKDTNLTKREVFFRDFLFVSYSFILAGFLSLLFQYKNVDAKGWWPLFIYLNSIYGVIFSLLFAYASTLLQDHRTYSIIFSIITLFTFTFSKYWHLYLDSYYLEGYFIAMSIIISLHLFLCIKYKFSSKH